MIKNCILIFLICGMIYLICVLFCVDHFKTINNLSIKYNDKKVIVPNKLKMPDTNEMNIINKKNSKLKNHPLTFDKQIFSMNVYPNIGEKQYCKVNDDCSQLGTYCYKNNDPLDRNSGVGICTLINPDRTILDIPY